MRMSSVPRGDKLVVQVKDIYPSRPSRYPRRLREQTSKGRARASVSLHVEEKEAFCEGNPTVEIPSGRLVPANFVVSLSSVASARVGSVSVHLSLSWNLPWKISAGDSKSPAFAHEARFSPLAIIIIYNCVFVSSARLDLVSIYRDDPRAKSPNSVTCNSLNQRQTVDKIQLAISKRECTRSTGKEGTDESIFAESVFTSQLRFAILYHREQTCRFFYSSTRVYMYTSRKVKFKIPIPRHRVCISRTMIRSVSCRLLIVISLSLHHRLTIKDLPRR